MAEENTSEAKEIDQNCIVTNPTARSEEGSLMSKDQIIEVLKPQELNPRRNSTGLVRKRATKPQVQSRYKGNYHGSSTHDFCKHGHVKKRDQDDVVKPWEIVRRRMSVEGLEAVKIDTLSSGKKPPRSVNGLTPVAAKRDVLAAKKKPCASMSSESSSVKEDGEMMAKSVDGSIVKSNEKVRKKKETASSAPKILKNKEKEKIQTVEDVKEKTVCVVESSVKGVQPTLSEKQTGSEDIEANPKPEKKIKPKRTGVKAILTKPLTFKKGKVLESKTEDTSPRWIKFRKRVVQEPKVQAERTNKKNLKKLDVETKTDSCEDSQQEKVVLRHLEVEGEKKKKMTLLNNVIEETMKKFTKVRKHKVDAMIGAFETVIALQDNKKSHKVQTKTTTTPTTS